MKLILAALDTKMVDCWSSSFGHDPNVEIYNCSILDLRVDAVVSAANSFGFMDGGLDYAYREFFGHSIEDRIRAKVSLEGEILVGAAKILNTCHPRIPNIIFAPTMRVPMRLEKSSVNIYLATRAALSMARSFGLSDVAFPAMGTGVGCVPHKVCAAQMSRAWEEFTEKRSALYESSWEAQQAHRELISDQMIDLQFTEVK